MTHTNAPTEMEQQHQLRWSNSNTAALVTHTNAQKHKSCRITTIQMTHQEDFNKLKRAPYKRLKKFSELLKPQENLFKLN